MPVPVLAGLQVRDGGQQSLHPGDGGAQVRGEGEVFVSQSLLELLSHLLEIGEVAGPLGKQGEWVSGMLVSILPSHKLCMLARLGGILM